MKFTVGYITSWRRTIFFTLIFSMFIFGVSSSIVSSLLNVGYVGNILCVGILVLCIALVVFVIGDSKGFFEGYGTASFIDGRFCYEDKKHKYDIDISSIKKVDIKPILLGQNSANPLAFQVLIDSGKKTFVIESERARGKQYNEVDLYRLYILLQKTVTY